MIQPLEAKEIADIDASATKAERFWRLIPVLGWTIAKMIWGERTRPIVKSIERQLESRSPPDSASWGANAAKAALAGFICRVATEEIGWPNDYFIPDDPASIVFWAYADCMDIESAVTEIEEHLGIGLEDVEVEAWFHQTLGEVVDFLWARQQAVHNQENVWPPAPRLQK